MISIGEKPNVNCVFCKEHFCYYGHVKRLPEFCPMKHFRDIHEMVFREYTSSEEVKKLCVNASIVESEGYKRWPRLREIIEYAKRLGIKKVGIAFCIGLAREANYIYQALRNAGFDVYSVCCKVGGINKLDLGVPREKLLRPHRKFEAICNPIGQALVLNKLGTELNVVVGLCVGHDSIFYRYSKAPVVTLISKDRVTGHNPAAVLYTEYYQEDFGIKP